MSQQISHYLSANISLNNVSIYSTLSLDIQKEDQGGLFVLALILLLGLN